MCVPQGRDEFPVEPAEEIFSSALIPVQKELGLAVIPEDMAPSFQLAALVVVVVNLAVHHGQERPVLIERGLRRRVDETKGHPPKGEAGGLVEVAVLPIPGVMPQPRRHLSE